ncbi:hypothetical protein [Actinokineospora sp.]|uniref:hypothetical protein n=1 Tax=Actinokineospora sp. TaxID=1872133 RepID=UPI00403813BD
MSQDWGQGQGNYGQEPGGYPQQGGYPQAPGYPQQGYPQTGGLPQAPAEYGGGPITRSGAVTSAAVLAFVQAGITTITTIIVLAGAANSSGGGGEASVSFVIGLVQLAGVLLLIFGGVQLMQGKGRGLLVAGAIVEIVLSATYLVAFAVIPTFGVDTFEGAKTFLILVALLFAVMPTISLIQALGASGTEWLRSRRGH